MPRDLETTGFPCVACGRLTRVVDSRQSIYGVRRRRACAEPSCGCRFTTYERSDYPVLAEEELREVVKNMEASMASLRHALETVNERRTRRPQELEPRRGVPLFDESWYPCVDQ